MNRVLRSAVKSFIRGKSFYVAERRLCTDRWWDAYKKLDEYVDDGRLKKKVRLQEGLRGRTKRLFIFTPAVSTEQWKALWVVANL